MRVEVRDDAPPEPATPTSLPDLDAESGRGRFLVESIATDSGVEPAPGARKVVWATFESDEDPDSTRSAR